MRFRSIIRKYRIEKILGRKTISENDRVLIKYLDKHFTELVVDRTVYKKDKYIYFYYSNTKCLEISNIVCEELAVSKYPKIFDKIKDYFETRFKVEVKFIY